MILAVFSLVRRGDSNGSVINDPKNSWFVFCTVKGELANLSDTCEVCSGQACGGFVEMVEIHFRVERIWCF